MIQLLLVALAQPVQPPMTVNDQILGKAEDFAVRGPARVCLMRTSIDLEPGETSYLDYLGIHWGAVRIVGRNGTLVVKEGDTWADRKGGRPFETSGYSRVVQLGGRRNPRYMIYGRSGNSNDEKPSVFVEGNSLGHGRDRSIIGRIQVGDGPPKRCRQRFSYGWDFILATENGQ